MKLRKQVQGLENALAFEAKLRQRCLEDMHDIASTWFGLTKEPVVLSRPILTRWIRDGLLAWPSSHRIEILSRSNGEFAILEHPVHGSTDEDPKVLAVCFTRKDAVRVATGLCAFKTKEIRDQMVTGGNL